MERVATIGPRRWIPGFLRDGFARRAFRRFGGAATDSFGFVPKRVMWGCFVAAGYWFWYESFQIGHDFDMDGKIMYYWLGLLPRLRPGIISTPEDFFYLPETAEEEIAARQPARAPDNRGLVVETSTILGSNGGLYRRMDYVSDDHPDWDCLPIQCLVKCKEEPSEEGETDWVKQECTTDGKWIMQLYHRLFCIPLIIAEKGMHINFSGEGRRALVLGTGGGAWASFLQEVYPSLHVDCVEIEPAVAAQATRWFGLEANDHRSVHVCDGADFVRKRAMEVEGGAAPQYDAVFVDMYVGSVASPEAQGPELFADLSTVMKPRSVIGVHLNTRDTGNREMWRSFHDEWREAGAMYRTQPLSDKQCPVSSLMVASKGWRVRDPLKLYRIRLRQWAREFSLAHDLPFDAGKKVVEHASPSFHGMERRSHRYRLTLDDEDRHRRELRAEILREELRKITAAREQAPPPAEEEEEHPLLKKAVELQPRRHYHEPTLGIEPSPEFVDGTSRPATPPTQEASWRKEAATALYTQRKSTHRSAAWKSDQDRLEQAIEDRGWLPGSQEALKARARQVLAADQQMKAA